MSSTTSPAPPTETTDREARRLDRQKRGRVAIAVAAAAAVGGAVAGAHPTDLFVADVLWSAAFAAGVTWFSAYARRWSWSWMGGIAAMATADRPVIFSLAVLALAVAVWSVRHERRLRVAGAIVGAVAVQPLLRIGDVGETGVPTLIVAAAVIPVVVSGYRQMPRRLRRRVRTGAIIVASIIAVFAVLAGAAALFVAGRMEGAVDSSRAAVVSASEADEKALSNDLRGAESDFSFVGNVLGSPALLPARGLPIVGPHLGALVDVADIGEDLTNGALDNLDRVDYDRLRYRRGQLDLDEVEAVSRRLARVRTDLRDAESRASDIDSPWLLSPVTNRVEQLDENLDDTIEQADSAQLAIDVAPDMLGGDGTRRYLVAFPTPAEMRGGGGFVGNYVILEAKNGKVTLAESSRIERLRPERAGTRQLEDLDGYESRYGRFRPTDVPQDTFLSPHMPWNAEAFLQIAEQADRGPIDGVFAMTPKGLAALLRFTGPIAVPGRDRPLRAGEAEDFLLRDQYLEYEDNEVRADALETLTQTTFDRLTSGSLPTPRELGAILGPLVPTRDLQMYAVRKGEQRVFDAFEVTGEFPAAGAHDLIHVSAINGGNSKIDVFLQRTITVEPRLDPATREITSKVTITLENSAPASGLPRYVIGNNQELPNGTNRMLLSVHTPLALDKARVDGEEVGTSAGRERGYRVYERYVEIGPGQTMKVELDLRGFIPGMGQYRLVVPAQSMVKADKLVVTGSSVQGRRQFTLDRTRIVGAGR